MSLVLNIDTATTTAQVNIARNGEPLFALMNTSQKDHAAFVQPAIEQVVAQAGIALAALDAVAVTAGPGSYTGLRVGLASAKGICYALGKPLIAMNTLEALAMAAIQQHDNAGILYCPMIDARRMEVFTAVYNNVLTSITGPAPLILTPAAFGNELLHNQILFFGNGAAKWEQLCNHPNASFSNYSITPESLSALSFRYFNRRQFSDLAYAEPAYLKDFKDYNTA